MVSVALRSFDPLASLQGTNDTSAAALLGTVDTDVHNTQLPKAIHGRNKIGKNARSMRGDHGRLSLLFWTDFDTFGLEKVLPAVLYNE